MTGVNEPCLETQDDINPIVTQGDQPRDNIEYAPGPTMFKYRMDKTLEYGFQTVFEIQEQSDGGYLGQVNDLTNHPAQPNP